MAEISRFHAIASAPDLLDAELHVALCGLAGVEPSYQPVPFGRGARHAFGKSMLSYFSDPKLEQRGIAYLGAEAVFEFFESALIAGPDHELPANGIALPSREFAQRQLDFERDTARRIRFVYFMGISRAALKTLGRRPPSEDARRSYQDPYQMIVLIG